MKVRVVFFVLTVLCSCLVCLSLGAASPDSDLERARQLWRDSKIKDYKMTITRDQEGVGGPASPVIITVKDGQAVSIKATRKVDTRPVSYYETTATVEKMFDFIEEKRREGWRVHVTYNRRYGYPERFGGATDESNAWWDFQINKFEIEETTKAKP